MTSMSLVIIGAFIYVLAWLLPAGVGYRGWEAFWSELSSRWPSKGSLFSEWYFYLHFKLTALSNFILAGTLLDVFLNADHPHPILRIALFVCAVLNTIYLVHGSLLRIGYYLWAGSFFLIAFGLPTSEERFFELALIVISEIAIFAGIYMAWMVLQLPKEIAETESRSVPPRVLFVLDSAGLFIFQHSEHHPFR